MTVSNRVANEQIIKEAGLRRRKLVSKPFPYFSHRIVSRINAPPEGNPPKRKESPKDRRDTHIISLNGMLKLE